MCLLTRERDGDGWPWAVAPSRPGYSRQAERLPPCRARHAGSRALRVSAAAARGGAPRRRQSRLSRAASALELSGPPRSRSGRCAQPRAPACPAAKELRGGRANGGPRATIGPVPGVGVASPRAYKRSAAARPGFAPASPATASSVVAGCVLAVLRFPGPPRVPSRSKHGDEGRVRAEGRRPGAGHHPLRAEGKW